MRHYAPEDRPAQSHSAALDSKLRSVASTDAVGAGQNGDHFGLGRDAALGVELNTHRRRAVIVDMDGTLCDVSGIRHYLTGDYRNFEKFHGASLWCPPNQQALDFCIKHARQGADILIVTAREEKWRRITNAWLEKHFPAGLSWYGPWMRKDLDYRPDHEIKLEIYNEIAQDFHVVAAVDDNPSIVNLWQSLEIETEVVPGWELDVRPTPQN